MTTKLYVGGIPYTSTEAGLTEAFSKAGSVVSSAVIIDRMTGRSQGFGFGENASHKEAHKENKII